MLFYALMSEDGSWRHARLHKALQPSINITEPARAFNLPTPFCKSIVKNLYAMRPAQHVRHSELARVVRHPDRDVVDIDARVRRVCVNAKGRCIRRNRNRSGLKNDRLRLRAYGANLR